MKIEYPLNQSIIDRCNIEMDANSHKGNSWMDAQQTPQWYLERKLQEEYAEFVISLKNNDYMIMKEGADLINIISMLIRRYAK